MTETFVENIFFESDYYQDFTKLSMRIIRLSTVRSKTVLF